MDSRVLFVRRPPLRRVAIAEVFIRQACITPHPFEKIQGPGRYMETNAGRKRKVY